MTRPPSEEENEQLYPQILKDYPEPFILNVTLIIIIGGVGNILTLMAVPYCLIWYPHKFQDYKGCTVLLLLQLSVCDLAYIITGLLLVLDIYIHKGLQRSRWLCWLSAFGRNWVAYTDFITLGFIALIRMVSIIFAFDLEMQLRIRSTTLAAIATFVAWALSFVLVCHILAEQTGWGAFDYRADHGMCNTIQCHFGDEVPMPAIITTVGVFVPTLTVMLSYIVVIPVHLHIYRKEGLFKQEQKNGALCISCCSASDGNGRRKFNVAKTNRALFWLAFFYIIFIIPVVIIEWLDDGEETSRIFYLIAYNWYWWLFAVNFIIYMFKYPEFREMYWLFLTDMLAKLCLRTESPDLDTNEERDVDPNSCCWSLKRLRTSRAQATLPQQPSNSIQMNIVADCVNVYVTSSETEVGVHAHQVFADVHVDPASTASNRQSNDNDRNTSSGDNGGDAAPPTNNNDLDPSAKGCRNHDINIDARDSHTGAADGSSELHNEPQPQTSNVNVDDTTENDPTINHNIQLNENLAGKHLVGDSNATLPPKPPSGDTDSSELITSHPGSNMDRACKYVVRTTLEIAVKQQDNESPTTTNAGLDKDVTSPGYAYDNPAFESN